MYASFRFRKRSDDDEPSQVRYNLPIEMLYTIAPIIIVVVLFYFTIQKQDKVHELRRPPRPPGRRDRTAVGLDVQLPA